MSINYDENNYNADMHVSFIKKAIPECTATCSVNLSKIVDKARELFIIIMHTYTTIGVGKIC